MAQSVVGMASLLQNMRIPETVNPVKVNLPSPPILRGQLAPNSWLSKAFRFANGRIRGPESMAIDKNGYIYTGLSNGWVVEVRPNGQVRGIRRMSLDSCGRTRTEDACGRPLGIRMDDRGYLVFGDAYNGIFKMDRHTGQYIQLVNTRNLQIDGKRVGFINDLAVKKDGSIFFTSSSSKWTRLQFLNIILEGDESGRVMMYNPHTRGPNKIQQLITGLSFPNGLQLAKDESYLLIAEGARCRIFRLWIGTNHPKRGSVEVFADNLPGFVDNIRLSPRGTFWVGLSNVRHAGRPSVLDTYGNMPQLRRHIMGMPKESLMARAPKHGIVVEMNEDGKIIRSLQDKDGTLFTAVSEVEEFRGRLFIGTFDRPFIGVLSLHSLPPPIKPGSDTAGPSHGGNGFTGTSRPTEGPVANPFTKVFANSKPNPPPTNAVPKSPSSRPSPTKSRPTDKPDPSEGADLSLGEMIAQMNKRMDVMSGSQLRDMVLVLLQQVMTTKKEASETLQRAVRLKSDMTKLRQMMGLPTTSTGTSSAAAASGTVNRPSKPTGTGTVTRMAANAKIGSSNTETGSGRDNAVTQRPTVVSTVSANGEQTQQGGSPQTANSGTSGTSKSQAAPSFDGGCVSGSLSCGVF